MIAQARAEAFLSALAQKKTPMGREVAVVVAHPDDETAGCGAMLARMPDVKVIIATDGAPRDAADARAAGYSTAQDYAAAREREMRAALAYAGISAITMLGFSDQGCVAALPILCETLRDIFLASSIALVLTHTYEGGHPDHDAVAFAVQWAAARVPRPMGIIEMPYYRAAGSDMAFQSFGSTASVTRVELEESEQALKRQMLAAYATQAQILAGFSPEVESFRGAPVYDFRLPPNNAQILYESREWGTKWADWQKAVDQCLAP